MKNDTIQPSDESI